MVVLIRNSAAEVVAVAAEDEADFMPLEAMFSEFVVICEVPEAKLEVPLD